MTLEAEARGSEAVETITTFAGLLLINKFYCFAEKNFYQLSNVKKRKFRDT